MRWYPCGTANTILRRDLKMRRISARWIHHSLAKEQKLARVRISKQLLKLFLKYINRSFANIITGDETWIDKQMIHNKTKTKEFKDLAYQNAP
jgi:hypothetical protein